MSPVRGKDATRPPGLKAILELALHGNLREADAPIDEARESCRIDADAVCGRHGLLISRRLKPAPGE